MKADPTLAALRRLQQTIRSTARVAPDESVRTRRVPGTRGRDSRYVMFNAAGRAAVEKAARLLRDDARYEHIKDPEEAAWELATAIAVDRRTDHVPPFVAEHSRHVEARQCYLMIDYLKTGQPWRIGDVDFLPIDHPSVPERVGWFRLGSHSGTVAVVTVAGTSLAKMADRARATVDNVLRLLRLDLTASQSGVGDAQLRFRAGDAYAFGEGIAGWRRRPDDAFELEAIDALAGHFAASPLQRLLDSALGELSSSLNVAATWLERAVFVADPLVDVLFSFFALEAILGRKSDALKGDSLAVRQMTLDHELTGGFSHPNKLWHQYDKIRSVAVHGGSLPVVTEPEARSLRHGVTRTLGQVVALAERESIRNKPALLRWLDSHRDLPRLAEWLIAYGGSDWREYFSRVIPEAEP